MSDRGILPVNTVTISVTSTTSLTPLTNTSDVVVCQNVGTKLCFVKLGTSGVTATTADFPLQPAGIVSLDQSSNTHIAAICGGSDSTTLYATVAAGLLVLS